MYPKSCIPSTNNLSEGERYGHHNLGWDLAKNRNEMFTSFNPSWGGVAEIVKEIDCLKPNNVVISTESCMSLNLEEIVKLKEFLENYEVKIIIYLRRQDEYFKSFYCQLIKQGLLTNDIKRFISDQRLLEKGDYWRLLGLWETVFGKNNLIIRLFEQQSLPDGVISDFLDIIALKHKFEFNDFYIWSNITPNIKIIKLLALLNYYVVSKLPISTFRWKQVCLGLSKPDNFLSQIIVSFPNFVISDTLISREECVKILQKFEESNRRVAREYFGRQGGQLFS